MDKSLKEDMKRIMDEIEAELEKKSGSITCKHEYAALTVDGLACPQCGKFESDGRKEKAELKTFEQWLKQS